MSMEKVKGPKGAATPKGQPRTVEANGPPSFAQASTSRKGKMGGPFVAFRSPTDRTWHYAGKRARVLAMLASAPDGITQWDTLPWHTRLGASIHALRRDGLVIDTQREGECRHARYRLVTTGRLIIQPENRRAAA